MSGPTHSPAESASFQLRLPCELVSVPQCRARVREWCRALGLRHETVADIQLAVTEAAANAVRHSGCDEFEVRGWASALSLTVCVWDQGRGLRERNPGAGLGIGILRALAESVVFEDTSPGTRVTMRFPVASAAG